MWLGGCHFDERTVRVDVVELEWRIVGWRTLVIDGCKSSNIAWLRSHVSCGVSAGLLDEAARLGAAFKNLRSGRGKKEDKESLLQILDYYRYQNRTSYRFIFWSELCFWPRILALSFSRFTDE